MDKGWRDREFPTITERLPSELADGPDSGDRRLSAPLYVIRVIRGPDTGKTFALDWNKTPEVRIGQGPGCELTLSDPRISRRHLSITPDGAMLRIVDRQSTNGTWMGGARILEALLEGGEVLELGGSALRVVRSGELRVDVEGSDRFGRVIGKSYAMRRLFTACEGLCTSKLPVIIEGETGTGKELLAEAIHDASPRASGPFVVFDCAAYDETTGFDALFGKPGHPGAIEQATLGTLVIDEVGQLGMEAQRRLVTSLEARGAEQGAAPDVRFIATTRQDLDRLVEEKKFHEELLFRLAGARVEVPPLRQRHGDIERIARHYWRLFGGAGDIPKAFLLRLASSDWPGNVHELEHAVSRAAALGDEHDWQQDTGEQAPPADFIGHVLTMGLPLRRARQLLLREFEQRFVGRAVSEHGGNVSRAAAASGMTRRYFHMLIARNK